MCYELIENNVLVLYFINTDSYSDYISRLKSLVMMHHYFWQVKDHVNGLDMVCIFVSFFIKGQSLAVAVTYCSQFMYCSLTKVLHASHCQDYTLEITDIFMYISKIPSA